MLVTYFSFDSVNLQDLTHGHCGYLLILYEIVLICSYFFVFCLLQLINLNVPEWMQLLEPYTVCEQLTSWIACKILTPAVYKMGLFKKWFLIQSNSSLHFCFTCALFYCYNSVIALIAITIGLQRWESFTLYSFFFFAKAPLGAITFLTMARFLRSASMHSTIITATDLARTETAMRKGVVQFGLSQYWGMILTH